MAVVLSFLLEVVLFSFQCLVYKYCMKIFRGDNSHVTKPRQLGTWVSKFLTSSMLAEFFSKLRAVNIFLRNVCDLHLSPMVGRPLAKHDTLHDIFCTTRWDNDIRNSATLGGMQGIQL